MLLTNNLFLEFLCVITAATLLFYIYMKWRFTYWARLGIEYPEPEFPFGNIRSNVNQTLTVGQNTVKIYNEMKARGAKQAGFYFFHIPSLMAIHPELIKRILQVDFAYFVDHGVYHDAETDPFSAHLFAIEGAKWKNLRAQISPAFTSFKVKTMFPTMVKTSEKLVGILDAHSCREPVEIEEVSCRLLTDIVGTCILGLECNSLSDPKAEFKKQLEGVIEYSVKDLLVALTSAVFPGAMRFFGLQMFRKSTTDFFMAVVKDVVRYRETNNVERNDLMQLLIKIKNGENISEDGEAVSAKSKMTIEELAAQVLVFSMAGFETTSSTISHTLLELSLNQDIQDKVRDEITAVLKTHSGEFTYDAVMDMTYMDATINETLRMHPPLPILVRKCTKDYKIPDTDVVLKKDTAVLVPVQALHYDPEYFPNPEIFDPARFTGENPSKPHQFTHLPFGEGPRICIGLRFGMVQMKVALMILLRNYRFTLNPRTEIPIKRETKHFLNRTVGGIWLNVERINRS